MTAYNLAAICALRILGAPPSLEVVGRGGVKSEIRANGRTVSSRRHHFSDYSFER